MRESYAFKDTGEFMLDGVIVIHKPFNRNIDPEGEKQLNDDCFWVKVIPEDKDVGAWYATMVSYAKHNQKVLAERNMGELCFVF